MSRHSVSISYQFLLEELQDCKTSRDAKHKELEELQRKYQQTQRILIYVMNRGVRSMSNATRGRTARNFNIEK